MTEVMMLKIQLYITEIHDILQYTPKTNNIYIYIVLYLSIYAALVSIRLLKKKCYFNIIGCFVCFYI